MVFFRAITSLVVLTRSAGWDMRRRTPGLSPQLNQLMCCLGFGYQFPRRLQSQARVPSFTDWVCFLLPRPTFLGRRAPMTAHDSFLVAMSIAYPLLREQV